MEENKEKELLEEMKEKEKTKEKVSAEPIKNQETVEQDKEEIQEKENAVEETEKDIIAEESKTTEEVTEIVPVGSKVKKPKKKSYITGTIGALLGTIIASIPWVITYSFAEMTVPAFAILIVVFAFLGYKIFRGKMENAFPAIIITFSLLAIILITTIICPCILMYQSGFPITFDNLVSLYDGELRREVRNAILQDLGISLIFGIIGMIFILRATEYKRKLKAKKVNAKFQAKYEQAKKQLGEQIETIKNVCTKLNCLTKEQTVSKKEILNELETTHNMEHKKAKKYLKKCVSYKLLKKRKGKYYYNEAKEQKRIEKLAKKKAKRSPVKKCIAAIILILIVALAAMIGYVYISTDYVIPNTNLRLNIKDSQTLYGTKESIIAEFGEDTSEYYDFIIMEENSGNSGIFGQIIEKTKDHEGYNATSIMKADRDYYASYIGEEATSEVTDKNIGLFKTFKSYNYTYEGTDKLIYRDVIYLYEAEKYYIFINVYNVSANTEIKEVDAILEDIIL